MRVSERAGWLWMAGLAVGLASILVFLYARTQDQDTAEYFETAAMLRELKQLNADWELDVLKSRIRVNASYDPLVQPLAEMKRLRERLLANSVPGGAFAAGALALDRAIEDKTRLVERFKSHNALLHNSRAFLPIAADDVAAALSPAAGRANQACCAHVAAGVRKILLDALVHSRDLTGDDVVRIGSALERLPVSDATLPAQAVQALDIFALHVRALLREQPIVRELVLEIAAVPVAARIDDLDNLLGAEQQTAARRARQYRQYLLVFAGALVGLLLYAAASLVRTHQVIRRFNKELRQANTTLEQRVQERTSELREAHAALLAEMEKERAAAQQVEYLAYHDRLTGLFNRSMFSQLLERSLREARRYSRSLAVMFVDLDRFKNINDTLGHEAGDLLLKEVAQRLKSCLRESDSVARLGGDEFVVMLPNAGDHDQLSAVAQKILGAVAQAFSLHGQEFRVTASVGISVYPGDGDDEATLMKHADIAMYKAKEDGKNNFMFFAPNLAQLSIERLAFESSLRKALEDQQFEVHYQPKVDCRTGRMNGVEALLRWTHPELGSVSPAQFIPVAEETGLIVPLGRWVLQTACEQHAAWRREGLPPLRVAVNLSARQFGDVALLSDITAILKETGIDPAFLELEITESMLMADPQRATQTLQACKQLGVSLSVDDFGTGYSSLSNLKRFPVDTIKVDRSFVRELPASEKDRAITDAILSMARTLSLSVVAEGVETQGQAEFLRDRGCDEIQGFFFSKAVPPAVIADMLKASPSAVLRGQDADRPSDACCGTDPLPFGGEDAGLMEA